MPAASSFMQSRSSSSWSSRRGSMAVRNASHAVGSENARDRAAAYLIHRHRFRPAEALRWVLTIAAYCVFPNTMTFGNQTLIMVMSARSLALILGSAAIVSLGHATFFGIAPYTVPLLIARFGRG